jgi:exosortase
VTLDRRLPATSWTSAQVLATLGLVALGVAATWDAWVDVFHLGTHDLEQNHVLLVPVIAAWLAWMRRGRLRRCPRDGRWIGPAFVGVGWILYSGGDRAGVQAAYHLGAIVVAVGCFLSVAGRRYLTRLLPAFVALAFLVPVPGVVRMQIALPLQSATAEATQRALDLLGVPAVRAGNALRINGVEIAIAEACNGLRMVFALFLVSYAFAYSMPIRDPVRLLIVAASPLTAIFCNVVRLVPTAWVYGYVSTDAGALLHDLGVWVMLPVAFLLLLGLFRTLRWALVPVYRYTLAYGR